MRPTDQMLARMAAESDEKAKFVDGVIEDAEKDGRDLTDAGARARHPRPGTGSRRSTTRWSRCRTPAGSPASRPTGSPRSPRRCRVDPGRQRRRVPVRRRLHPRLLAGPDRQRRRHATARPVPPDRRPPAHHADSAGVLPEPVVAPIVNFVDAARPLVSALGPRPLPSKTWTRPKVTQHTAVARAVGREDRARVAEDDHQRRDRHGPDVRRLRQRLAGRSSTGRQPGDHGHHHRRPGAAVRASQTENDATDTFLAAATAASTNLATGANTAAQVTAAFWGAVGQVYAGTKGQGRVIAAMPPQMLGLLGPLFAPVNPQNAQSTGFSARSTTGRAPPAPSRGVPIYVTAGLADNKILVLSTAAAEVYETRVGALSGRRAFRARRPGRLRRPLHPAGDRRHRDHRDHEDAMSELLGRPQPAGSRARPGRSERRAGHSPPPQLSRTWTT